RSRGAAVAAAGSPEPSAGTGVRAASPTGGDGAGPAGTPPRDGGASPVASASQRGETSIGADPGPAMTPRRNALPQTGPESGGEGAGPAGAGPRDGGASQVASASQRGETSIGADSVPAMTPRRNALSQNGSNSGGATPRPHSSRSRS